MPSLGLTALSGAYLGTTAITRVYLGSTLVADFTAEIPLVMSDETFTNVNTLAATWDSASHTFGLDDNLCIVALSHEQNQNVSSVVIDPAGINLSLSLIVEVIADVASPGQTRVSLWGRFGLDSSPAITGNKIVRATFAGNAAGSIAVWSFSGAERLPTTGDFDSDDTAELPAHTLSLPIAEGEEGGIILAAVNSNNAVAISAGGGLTELHENQAAAGLQTTWFARNSGPLSGTEAPSCSLDPQRSVMAAVKIVGLGSPALAEYVTTLEEQDSWTNANDPAGVVASFSEAIAEANANAGSSSTTRGVIELAQGTTYLVEATNGANQDPNAAITFLSDVEIRTAGKPTGGTQAVVKWESWAGKSGVHNQTIFAIEDVSNVLLGWVTVDGNKNTLDDETSMNYTQGRDGGILNILVNSQASDFTIKHVLSRHALTDGLLITRAGGGVGAHGGLIEDCTFTRCRRQGCSIGCIGVEDAGFDQVVFLRCEFTDTGDFSGDIGGQQPGWGVDIETDSASSHIDGATFDNCDFTGNLGSAWHHGDNVGGRFGRGWCSDCEAPLSHIKLINCVCSGNAHEDVSFVVRDDTTVNRLEITSLVCSSSGNVDWIRFYANPANTGHLTNVTITNANVQTIFFEADFRNTGHSVQIYRGNFNPTITTNGAIEIATFNGFP